MKHKLLLALPIAVMGVVAVSFTTNNHSQQKNGNGSNVKLSYEPNASTVEFEDMNPAVSPTDDFFEYVNGKWIDRTPIPATESSWGKFNVLSDNNNKILRGILEQASKQKNEPGSIYQLIGDFYYCAMDSVKREADGIKPIQGELAMIDQLKDLKGLPRLMAHQHKIGTGTFFGFGVEQDLKDNTKMALYNGAGGLSLPSSEYYTKTDTSSEKIKTAYKAHLVKMFGFIGMNPKEAQKAALDVYGIEAMLADSSLTPLEERDIEATYNKMSWAQLQKMIPDFNLDVYAREYGIKMPVGDVIVTVPKFMRQFQRLISTKSIGEIKNYMKWKTLNANADMLSMAIEKADFAFFSTTIKGTKQMKPSWKRAIGSISNSVKPRAAGLRRDPVSTDARNETYP